MSTQPLSAGIVNSARRQHGVSLVFALVTLVALSLAAVALVRSVNTSGLVIGNLGFKQDSTLFSGQASEEAIAWLNLNKVGTTLDSSVGAEGYHATANENLDPTNKRAADPTRAVVDWDGNGCATPYASGTFATCLSSKAMSAASSAGNNARYLITRLCAAALPPDDVGNSCAKPLSASLSEGGEKGEINYNRRPGGTTVEPGPYFRIVVRTVGARNAISYTETIVHF